MRSHYLNEPVMYLADVAPSEASKYTFTWKFDGKLSELTGPKIFHTWNNVGVHNIELITYNKINGLKSSKSTTVNIILSNIKSIIPDIEGSYSIVVTPVDQLREVPPGNSLTYHVEIIRVGGHSAPIDIIYQGAGHPSFGIGGYEAFQGIMNGIEVDTDGESRNFRLENAPDNFDFIINPLIQAEPYYINLFSEGFLFGDDKSGTYVVSNGFTSNSIVSAAGYTPKIMVYSSYQESIHYYDLNENICVHYEDYITVYLAYQRSIEDTILYFEYQKSISVENTVWFNVDVWVTSGEPPTLHSLYQLAMWNSDVSHYQAEITPSIPDIGYNTILPYRFWFDDGFWSQGFPQVGFGRGLHFSIDGIELPQELYRGNGCELVVDFGCDQSYDYNYYLSINGSEYDPENPEQVPGYLYPPDDSTTTYKFIVYNNSYDTIFYESDIWTIITVAE